MKKIINVVTAIFLISFTVHGQNISREPKIVHEEEELTVFDDGKAIEKYYVGKHSEQKNEIEKDARDRKKRIEVKQVKKPKLKFYSEKGVLIKEIDLANEESKGRVKETRPLYKKGEFDAKMVTVKWPNLSKQGKYAVVDNTTFADAGYTVPIPKILLYDVRGNILFEKTLPLGEAIYGDLIGTMVVSDNGTVAFRTNDGEEGPKNERLYAYDRTGKQLLLYPEQGQQTNVLRILKISLNGRYLAIRAEFEHRYERTVFFDLDNNLFWKSDKSYSVYELSDEGIAEVYYQDEKNQSGSTEVLDIAARMKP